MGFEFLCLLRFMSYRLAKRKRPPIPFVLDTSPFLAPGLFLGEVTCGGRRLDRLTLELHNWQLTPRPLLGTSRGHTFCAGEGNIAPEPHRQPGATKLLVLRA